MRYSQPTAMDRHRITCPECRNGMVEVSADTATVIDREHWLFDSDTLPGLPSEIDDHPGLAAMLSLGRCNQCNAAYWAADVTLIDSDRDGLHEYMAGVGSYAHIEHIDHRIGAANDDATWWMIRSRSGGAVVHEHLVGPFRAPARRDYQAVWSECREVVANIWPDAIRMFNADRAHVA